MHRPSTPQQRLLPLFLLILLFFPFAGSTRAAPSERPPNIVLILVDDLGYSELGCYGSEQNRTPRIDRMADRGLKLTNFYSASAICTPSRAALLTGSYPRRVSLHQDAEGKGALFPGARKGLHPNEITIADLLKKKGYATACIGKWHLGDQKPFLPTRQGFDTYFGIPYSNDMSPSARPERDFPPLPLIENETVVDTEPDQSTLTKRFTHKSLRFIRNHRDQPFLLYLAHAMVHWPYSARKSLRGEAGNGRFGDALLDVDHSTGQILDLLKKLDLQKKTLVIFTSDNGAPTHHRPDANKPLRGGKGSVWEGGMRVPCIVYGPGTVPSGRVSDELTTTLDLLPTIAHLAGTNPPENRRIDGHDIRPILTGAPNAASPYKTFFYYLRGELKAVRNGPWKYHLKRDQLYHLRRDPGEKNDVSEQHPEVVRRLTSQAANQRGEIGDGSFEGARQRPAGVLDHAEPLTDDE